MLAAFGLLFCHLLLAFALIPPWQQPDEPTFVAWAELRRNQLTGRADGPDPGREGEILQSMAAHQWWQHRTGEWPATIPKDFNVTGTGTPASALGRPPVYPWVTGRLLLLFPPLPVVWDLYVLRALSAVLAFLTLWVAWRGARECLGPLGGAVTAIVLALHPQFAIVSTAASSDAMANLLAACAWWQMALALRRTRVVLHLAAMWCAVLVASLTDRMAVPLVATGVVASLIAFVEGIRHRHISLPVAAAVTAVFLGAALALLQWAPSILRDELRSYNWPRLFSLNVDPVAMTWPFFESYTLFVHQSWWFSLGWGRYPLPGVWPSVVVFITALAAIGVCRRLVSDRTLDTVTRTLIGVAVVSLLVQAGALYWMYFRVAGGAQGKSLFPALVPCLVLLWAGLEAWVPRARRAHAAVALVSVLVLLDLTVWIVVAIPAYYASF